MKLPVLSFTAMVEQMGAYVQGSATPLIDLTVGSILRALLEACASLALWLQWLVLQVLSATRAATSAGADLDSWMADFSFARLSGTASVGVLTFSRFTAGLTATIGVGTVATTSDGSQKFSVVADAANSAWNGADGYVLEADQSSIDLPATATLVGLGGNVLANSISLIAAPIAGVDNVANTLPFTGGTDGESDEAFRARFLLYINSRSAATAVAIKNAAFGVKQVVRCAVLENGDDPAMIPVGHFYVVADDGSGHPSNDLLAEVQSAVELVRPVGTSYSIFGPQILPVDVALTIVTSDASTKLTVAVSIQSAIIQWVQTLPIGGTLAISKLEALAHATDASVLSVTSCTINGATADVVAPVNAVILLQTVTVS